MSQTKTPLINRISLSAAAGCIASTCCHPLDVIRIQMQTKSSSGTTLTNPLEAAKHIYTRGGFVSFYGGLSAAYLRQFTYSAFRMGTFSYILEIAKGQNKSTEVPLSTKLLCGATAGIVGSIIGNPAEIALVQMGNDSKLPAEARRNYKSSLHACAEIIQKDGFQGLWRGVVNSSMRAAVLNSMQLGLYGPIKSKLVEIQPSVFMKTTSISTMFIGANISAFFAIGASMPMDVVKSRQMSMRTDGTKPEYTGMIDCFQKTYQRNGILVFWRGFLPAFVKLAPYTVISFTALETFTKLTGNSSAF